MPKGPLIHGDEPSQRLIKVVDALPLFDGIRVLEIGCGPGVATREIARRIGNGHVLGIDRSSKAIEQAIASASKEIASGCLTFRQAAVEDFHLLPGDEPYDIAFAIRVGALDGRHPRLEQAAFSKIAKALKRDGKLFIDGGTPLKEVSLDSAWLE